MADAKVTEVEEEKYVPGHYETVKTRSVVLRLTEDEAATLVTILYRVGGSAEGPRPYRVHADSVLKALGRVRVREMEDTKGRDLGSIYLDR